MTSGQPPRTALITGASSGIGRALALALAKENANLILAARSADGLKSLASEASAFTSGQVVVLPCDVSAEDQVRRLAEVAQKAMGSIDILVNNAGVGYSGTVADSDPAQVREMIDTNLWGAYLATHYCLPLMSGGDIVNIVSVAGLKYSPGFAMYSATKFAMRAFSEALRNEVQGAGIRVLTVHPGMTDTRFYETFAPDGQAPVPVDAGELLSPDQVAEAIVNALAQPPGVAINELVIRPAWQER